LRDLALIITATLLAAWPAVAQSDSNNAPTYFLIDASGSMSRGANWGDVEDIVSRRAASILEIGADTKFSFNRIAGDARKCKTPIAIEEPQPFSAAVLSPPNQTGATLLGPALQRTIEVIGDKESRVIIVTDGSEQCGPSICEVAEELLPERQHITVDLIFTEDALPSDKTRLSCAQSAQGRSLTTSGPASSPATVAANSENSGAGAEGGQTPLTWLTALLVAGISFLAGCVVLLLLMASRRNEEIASGEEPSQQGVGWSIFGISLLGATVSLGVLFGLFGPQFAMEWPSLYNNLNGSLLSLLVSNAALGLIGWSLIQIWGINEFRQKNSSRKWKLNQEAKQFSQVEKPLLDRKRATRIREAKTAELRSLLRYFGTLDRDDLKSGWTIVDAARDQVETIAALFIGSAGYEKRKVVRELSTMGRFDYLPLIDILREQERLDSATYSQLSKLFSDWETVTARRAQNQTEALQAVLAFDPKAIRSG
jgi:hypothetical protein